MHNPAVSVFATACTQPVHVCRTLTGDEVDGLVGGSTVQHGLLALALRLQLAVDLTEQVHQLDARVRLARPCRYSQCF